MLTGKTALITGGNSGIGLATAQKLLEQGARVAITGRDAEKLEQARRALGPGVITVVADVRSREQLRQMAATVEQAFGGLDIFFAMPGWPLAHRCRAPPRSATTNSWTSM